MWSAKNSGVTRLLVASQVTAFAPFSQSWKVEVCSLSGQAQPGQSKPSGLFMRSGVSSASTTSIWSRTASAVAFRGRFVQVRVCALRSAHEQCVGRMSQKSSGPAVRDCSTPLSGMG